MEVYTIMFPLRNILSRSGRGSTQKFRLVPNWFFLKGHLKGRSPGWYQEISINQSNQRFLKALYRRNIPHFPILPWKGAASSYLSKRCFLLTELILLLKNDKYFETSLYNGNLLYSGSIQTRSNTLEMSKDTHQIFQLSSMETFMSVILKCSNLTEWQINLAELQKK